MTQATRSNLMSVATTLAANINATQDYIPVASTANFSTSVVAEVETTNEVVSFDSITTNLQVYSQDFDNAAWSKSNVTVAANSTTAPDGTTTAETLTTNTATGGHLIYDSLGTLDATAYAYSVYLKANASNFGFIGQYDGSNYNGIVVDLSSGSITNTSGSVTSSSVEDVGSGWYRLKCVKTFSAVTSYILISLSDSGTPSYSSGRPNFTGVDESIYVWGAQVEKASSVTGYLPTTSASLSGLTTVTRGANGTTAASASSGDDIQQLPYALLNVDMPVRLTGLSVSSDGTGAGRLTLCDKVGTHLCDVDINEDEKFTLNFGGGILFPNGIYVANSDNITAYTLYTSGYNSPNLTAGG